jgi:hypothetical protein
MTNIDDYLINYNWMPCAADWSVDLSEEFYRSAGVSKLCDVKPLTIDQVDNIHPYDIIFVKTDYLKHNQFQTFILPRIKVPFILISGISDYTVDYYETILSNSYCIKWFCTNPPCKHEKIIELPIGFQEHERVGGNQILLKSFQGKQFVKKIEKILLPYHTESSNPTRVASIEYLKSLPFIDVQKEKLNFEDYLTLLSQYKYCICLEGNGADTHRNYECLLVNTVPIMKNSTIGNLYNRYSLPFESINTWNEVNDSFCESLKNKEHDHSNVANFLQIKNHLLLIRTYKEFN